MLENSKSMPSVDAWLREAKADVSAADCGMYLTHNGVVRATPKAEVRGVETDGVAPGQGGRHGLASMPKRCRPLSRRRARCRVSAMCACGWRAASLPWATTSCSCSLAETFARMCRCAAKSLVGTIKNECVSEVERRRKGLVGNPESRL